MTVDQMFIFALHSIRNAVDILETLRQKTTADSAWMFQPDFMEEADKAWNAKKKTIHKKKPRPKKKRAQSGRKSLPDKP